MCMVYVRHMSMAVPHRRVDMKMAVRSRGHWVVRMLVMTVIMSVGMFMHQGDVIVRVVM